MKKVIVRPFSQFVILLALVFSQFVFATAPLKPDDPDVGSQPNAILSTSLYTESTTVMSIISVDLVGSEIMVNFDSPVGIATVTVKDKKSNVVYQTTVDTNSTAEVAVPVSGLSKGDYTVTVVYGTSTFVEVVSIP